MCYFAQRNHLWYGSYYQSYHLVKLMIIHCYSPGPICLLHRPNRQVLWDYAFWNWVNKHWMGLGKHWAYCEKDLS